MINFISSLSAGERIPGKTGIVFSGSWGDGTQTTYMARQADKFV